MLKPRPRSADADPVREMTSRTQSSTAFTGGGQLAHVLRRDTAKCGVDLFAAYGIRLALAPALPPARPEPAFLSIGGFAGPCFAGFFIMGANEAVLRRCNSTRSSSSDWIGELGNQLLGRIKNCLVREGIPVHRVPPAVVQASVPSALHLHPGMESVKLSDERDAIWLWIEWEVDGAVVSASALPPSETDVLVEGDAILF